MPEKTQFELFDFAKIIGAPVNRPTPDVPRYWNVGRWVSLQPSWHSLTCLRDLLLTCLQQILKRSRIGIHLLFNLFSG